MGQIMCTGSGPGLFYVVFIFCFLFVGANCVVLDSDGGYHVIVGISDDKILEEHDPLEYINSLKAMISNFASLLWTSTKAIFYIKSVHILIPAEWGLNWTIAADVSTQATYDQADIQMTNATKDPIAANYYPCGRPGLRILLPFAFVDSSYIDALYGSQSKGLLNLWLRYRFGVWEEHGYPEHSTTPYVYNENDIEYSDWKLTACNDVSLHGHYEFYDYDAHDTVNCSTDGTNSMMGSCRFKPDIEQDVKSSMMNFQWIRANSELCDEVTHDTHAPNRQNLYCGHKSIWEVIRENADFQLLNITRDEGEPMPTVEFRIVVPDPKPHLYILLDLSEPSIFPDQHMYNVWVDTLQTFVEHLPANIVTTLVAYPNRNDNSTMLQVLVDWTLLDANAKRDIKRALDFSHISRVTIDDFRLAMYEAVSHLKAQNHPNGAFLLFLRTGDNINPVKNPLVAAYEEDFLLDFRRYGITLFAIAVNIVSREERPVFEYLATESEGVSALIRPGDDAATKMEPVLEEIGRRLREAALPVQDIEYEIIYKERLTITLGTAVHIPKRSDIDWLYIYVTTSPFSLELNYIHFEQPDPGNHFQERIEWSQNVSYVHAVTRVYSNKFDVSKIEENDNSTWELYMWADDDTNGDNTTGIVLVYGTRLKEPKQVATARGWNRIIAEISTSAVSNEYDCNSTEVSVEPLAIYFNLWDGDTNKPILSRNASQSASLPAKSVILGNLMYLETGVVHSTVLVDSGTDADLLKGDGVYSGYIYPSDTGDYRVYVTLTDYESAEAEEVSRTINPMGRIPSVEQNDMEVTVVGTTLNTPYSIVFESPLTLHSKTECRGKRHIGRVVDTEVAVTEADTEIVRVSFTVPVMTASADVHFEGNEWELYYMGLGRFAEDIDTLNDDVSKGELQVFIIPMTMAGQRVVRFLPRNNSITFAFELLDYRQSPTKSTPSNIVRIRGWRPNEQDGGRRDDEGWCDMECLISIGGGCGLLIFILVLISLFLWRNNRQQQTQLMLLSRDEVKEFLNGHQISKSDVTKAKAGPASGQVQAQPNEYLDTTERIQSLPYDSKHEIPNNKLHIDKTELLGSGTFGNVYKGYVVNMPGATGKVLVVAVKTMKPNMDKSCFMALLTEVKLMTHIGNSHPNIVKLIGACTKNIRKCEVFLATAFCENGSLSSYLLKLNETNFKNLINEEGKLKLWDEAKASKSNDKNIEMATTWTLIKWAREITNGMSFLGQKKIVHGDLAARNILLDTSLVAKISDFGLSKKMLQTYGSYNYQTEVEVEGGGLLPWKWLAPEALTYMKFSVASDVWAYGVTIWEIFTLGQVPYPGVKWSPDFVNQLEKGGLRLQKPNYATDTIYEIMCDCWKLEPKTRAGFNQIKSDFDHLLTGSGPGDYMSLQQ